MRPEAEEAAAQFVQTLIQHVFEGSVQASRETLNGEYPSALTGGGEELAAWYQSLDEVSKEMVDKVIRLTADTAAFSTATLLDGASCPEWDSLTITTRSDEGEVSWDPELEGLHDLYRADVAPW